VSSYGIDYIKENERNNLKIALRGLPRLSSKFEEVLPSVFLLSADVIKSRDPEFRTIHPIDFKGLVSHHISTFALIGVIDGTHIPVISSSKLIQHTGRHGYISENVVAIYL